MSSTITYNLNDIQSILRKNGWSFHHQKGSHMIYKNNNGQHLTIARCKCNKMIIQRLIKEYGLVV